MKDYKQGALSIYQANTEDYKQGALSIYPVSLIEIEQGFKIDINAGKRAVAEVVLKLVFEKLKKEHVAGSVSKAFLRRARKWGTDNDDINTANMSTALISAIIAIRDDE